MSRFRRASIMAGVVLLATCSGSEAQMIVAHRGASFDAPENTLAAFREAWKQGADAIEADFYLTQDGRIVCFHDKTTSRTTGGAANLTVSSATWEQLRALDVGAWKNKRFAGERIPTIEEVLAVVPRDGIIFVELKSGPEIVAPLQKSLENSQLRPEQVVIICFNEEVIKACRKRMPQFKANWLTSYKQNKQTGQWSPSQAEVLETLQGSGATGFGTAAKDEVVTAELTKAVRDAGIEPHVWTVNDPEQARHYAALGFQSITTDKPAVIRQAVLDGTTE